MVPHLKLVSAAPTEEPEMQKAITWLEKAGIPYTRPKPHMLKIGTLCFYPRKGSMHFDNQPRENCSGLAGLRALLQPHYQTQLPPVETLE